MLRIHFTADDLIRTRLRPTLGPVGESAFALGLLAGPAGPVHRRLRAKLSARLGAAGGRAGVRAAPDPAALLRLAEMSHATKGGLGQAPTGVAAEVLEVWRSAVAPHWPQLLEHLTAECEFRARTVTAGGVESLLSALHPRITWRAPMLEIAGPEDGEVHLGGRGLVLMPSVFLSDRPAVLIGDRACGTPPGLVVAAPPDGDTVERLFTPCDGSGPRALGALVGRTRAAALRELTVPCTTSQLAERLGISSAGASQHTSVLRESGLITTRRVRNSVLHTVTGLGLQMLGAWTGPGAVGGIAPVA